ncbi:DUF6368 family protein [Deinococcus roseus]|uniref:Uncharacterized protein n=1 Tax=Deinococcus roseus TaxID=392414 RepID=A0ABQ2DIF7_9DEIO|nr:DUF6368 family protein [Deinococcus roseus]GGJ58281.1 hypothetical protein GCM10008938_50460 [Deinococcus roseus]
MGGPAVEILLQKALTPQQKDMIHALCSLSSVFIKRKDDDLSFNISKADFIVDLEIKNRLLKEIEVYSPPPLLISFTEMLYASEDQEIINIETWMGLRPENKFQVGAMSNGLASHLAVGALAAFLARSLHGLIDFGGVLNGADWSVYEYLQGKNLSFQENIALYDRYFDGHAGRLWAIPYETASEETWFSHYGDADFLEWWLKHPEFRMVK